MGIFEKTADYVVDKIVNKFVDVYTFDLHAPISYSLMYHILEERINLPHPRMRFLESGLDHKTYHVGRFAVADFRILQKGGKVSGTAIEISSLREKNRKKAMKILEEAFDFGDLNYKVEDLPLVS